MAATPGNFFKQALSLKSQLGPFVPKSDDECNGDFSPTMPFRSVLGLSTLRDCE